MRIVSWNCNMAFHNKYKWLLELRPDIAVISECADLPTFSAKLGRSGEFSSAAWAGFNKNKGLGVFAFNGFCVRALEDHDPALGHVFPLNVSGPLDFNLLAVWAQNDSAGVNRRRDPGPLRKALDRYRGFLETAPAIVAGDWNSSVIWDRPGWQFNHAEQVELLSRLGLESVYHAVRGEKQGEESRPTLYWRDRRKDGPSYHVDYIFAPRQWIEKLTGFEVGEFERWCGSGLSDHVPLIADFDL